MAEITTLDIIFGWFTRKKKPTQQQFQNAWFSFRHKLDKIGMPDLTDEVKQAINNSSGGAVDDIPFDGNRPLMIDVNGLKNTTPNTSTVKELLDFVLFKGKPVATISITANAIKEFGGAVATTLAWAVTKGGNAITGITVAGTPVAVTGNSDSGSVSRNSVQNTNTSFVISVTDGVDTVTASVTDQWRNAMYWGYTTAFATMTDVQIRALSGAGVGTGKELVTTFVRTLNGINAAGNYLAFAWPTAWGTPRFVVNGLTNTAFTKLRDNSDFTNVNGYVAKYDLWVMQYQMNSPIDSFAIQI